MSDAQERTVRIVREMTVGAQTRRTECPRLARGSFTFFATGGSPQPSPSRSPAAAEPPLENGSESTEGSCIAPSVSIPRTSRGHLYRALPVCGPPRTSDTVNGVKRVHCVRLSVDVGMTDTRKRATSPFTPPRPGQRPSAPGCLASSPRQSRRQRVRHHRERRQCCARPAQPASR